MGLDEKILIEDIFPELPPTEEGLREALIKAHNLELDPEAFNNIREAFYRLKQNGDVSFYKNSINRVQSEKIPYRTKNQNNLNYLDFEVFIDLVIDVVLFSRKFDNSINDHIREYRVSKGLHFEQNQNWVNLKVAQLATYILIDSDENNIKKKKRLKLPSLNSFLNDLFASIGIPEENLKCIRSNDSFKKLITNYLNFSNSQYPSDLSMYSFEGKITKDGVKVFKKAKF